MSPVRLGIEVEFMVGVPKAQNSRKSHNPDPNDKRWPDNAEARDIIDACVPGTSHRACIRRVAETLASCGFPVATFTVRQNQDPNDPLIQGTDIQDFVIDRDGRRYRVWNNWASVATEGTSSIKYDYWHIQHENYLTWETDDDPPKGMPKGYAWHALEFSTPIISDQAELEQQLPSVRKALMLLRKDIKIWVSSDCGLHIHASPLSGTVGSLDPLFAKKVVALVVLAEDRLLLDLCHPCRSTSPYASKVGKFSYIAAGNMPAASQVGEEEASCIKSVRDFRSKAQAERKKLSTSEPAMLKILELIFSQPTLSTLAQGISTFGSNPVSGRSGLAISDYGTFEFRYPEASFDPEFVALWADIARRFLTLAVLPQDEYCRKLVELYGLATSDKLPTYTTWLQAIGMGDMAQFCRERMRAYNGSLKNLDKQGILPRVSQD